MLISNMRRLFSDSSKKVPKKRHSWFKIKAFCFSLKLCHKMGGCWFQIWEYSFHSLAQNLPKKTFLVPNIWIFIFAPNFATRQFRGSLFQIWRTFSLYFNSKISKSGISGPKLKDFYFCTNLCSKTNSRTKISIAIIVFSNYNRKISKSGVFGPKFRHFCFSH